jgi:hypothetical protein
VPFIAPLVNKRREVDVESNPSVNKEITLLDNESVQRFGLCDHKFILQANVKVDGIIYDIYFCSKCLFHVKKERPCPYNLEEIKEKQINKQKV